ncbi:hypothetical protein TNCV_1717141 [Trichonephila clavipes]|nr:hypothetical protein TNCV_1717141 [Trichonephila clavipes]
MPAGAVSPYSILNATGGGTDHQNEIYLINDLFLLQQSFAQSTNVIRKIVESMLLAIISIAFGIIEYVCLSSVETYRTSAQNKPRTIPVSFGRLDTSIATESSL